MLPNAAPVILRSALARAKLEVGQPIRYCLYDVETAYILRYVVTFDL